MKLPGIDYGKAQTLLKYLALATRSQLRTSTLQRQLQSQVRKLRTLNRTDVRQKLLEAEKKLAQAYQTEKTIEQRQRTHQRYHHTLHEKIDILDRKLENCLAGRKAAHERISAIEKQARVEEATHGQRIRDLETRLHHTLRSRAQQMAFLKLDIAKAEHLLNELGETNTTRGRALRMRIDELKDRVQSLERKK